MPKPRKPAVQYGTLDVLLMYLLGYKQKVVRIRKDAFDYHSYWFSKQPLRCVSVEVITDKQGKQWVVLTRRNQQAIQYHLDQFFIAYDNNTVETPYRKLAWLEWDYFLQKLFNRHFIAHRKLIFAFAGQSVMIPYGSEACAFHCMANTVYCALHHDTDDVLGVSLDAAKNCAYVTYKTTYQQGKRILVARFGEIVSGWRTRAGVRWAFYKNHYVKFHSHKSKQKRLLDMLLEFDLKVPLEYAAKELNISGDIEYIKASLYDIGAQLHKKAIDACRGTKDKVTFEISTAGNSVQMLETLP